MEIVLLIVVIVGAGLVGFGVFLGVAIASASRTARQSTPTPRTDLDATLRTISRLAFDGVIDADLKARIVSLLRARGLGREAEVVEQLPVVSRPTANAAAAREPFAPSAFPSDEMDWCEEETSAANPVEATLASPQAEPAVAVAAAAATAVDSTAESSTPAARPHPLDAAETAAPPTSAQQRKRALADVLQSFMEEKNMRWGELISGVLIVGCSIALVISLRREIESLTERFIYLPALLFMMATGAIHAAGNYTLRQWNLQATSRGVLIIATLLIPINFLAAILVTGPESRQLSVFHPLYLSALGLGFAVFGAMAYFAGRALMRENWLWLWIAVIATSAGQPIINRLAPYNTSALAAFLLVAAPLAGFLAAIFGQLREATRRPQLGLKTSFDTLLVLGVATFSLAAPIGLLIFRSDTPRDLMAWLATPLSLPAVGILATGLALHGRAMSSRLAAVKTVGAWLTLIGGVLLAAAVLLAWPRPELLITVGLFHFVALTLLAVAVRMPALHFPAIAGGGLAFVFSAHMLLGSFTGFEGALARHVINSLASGTTAAALSILSAVIAVVGVSLTRGAREADGRAYLVATAALACLSVLLALVVGFAGDNGRDPWLATPILLFYAIALLIAGRGFPHPGVAWTVSTLFLAGLVHGLAYNDGLRAWLSSHSLLPARAVLVALIAHGVIISLAAAGMRLRDGLRLSSDRWRHHAHPLLVSALAFGALAAPLAIVVIEGTFSEHTAYVSALSLTWMVAALLLRSWQIFAAAQSLATCAVVYATAAICQQRGWLADRVLTPEHVQVQLAVLGVWCLAWNLGRRCAAIRWPAVSVFFHPRRTVDQTVVEALVTALFGLCLCCSLPAVVSELGLAAPESWKVLASWSPLFATPTWLVAGLLLCGLAASLAERRSWTSFLALLLVASLPALLIAGVFESSIAVASAQRWAFAFCGVVVTGLIIGGRRIQSLISPLRVVNWEPVVGDTAATLGVAARSMTLSLMAIPVIGITTMTLFQAARGEALGGPVEVSFFVRIGSELSFGVPLFLLSAALVAHAVREKRPQLMLLGSAVFQYLVNLGYFLPILKDPAAQLDWAAAIGCLQWNAIGLASYTLVWLAIRRWVEPRRGSEVGRLEEFLAAQTCAVAASLTLIAGMATAVVVVWPEDLTASADLGGWPSYVAGGLGAAAIGWLVKRRLEQFAAWAILVAICATGGPLAISLAGSPGSWRAFHVLMSVWTGVALIVAGFSWSLMRRSAEQWLVELTSNFATAVAVLSFLLALRAQPFDPQSPWWSCGATLGSAAALATLAWRGRRHACSYVSTVLISVAIAMVWFEAWPVGGPQGTVDLLHLSCLGVVVAAFLWLAAELHSASKAESGSATPPTASSRRFPDVHRAVAGVVLSLMCCATAVGFLLTGLIETDRAQLNVAGPLAWTLALLLVVLLAGAAWDSKAKLVLPALYAWGLMTLVMCIDVADERFQLNRQAVFVVVGLAVATHIAVSGHLWRMGAVVCALAHRLRVPDPVDHLKRVSMWMPGATLVITCAVVIVELTVVLAFEERWMRVSAAFAPILLAYGVACQAQRERRSLFQLISLTLLTLSAVYAGWSDIEPGWGPSSVFDRTTRLLLVLSTAACLFGLPVSRWTERRFPLWHPAVRRTAVNCGLAGLAALCLVLMLEVRYFVPGEGVPVSDIYQVISVAVILIGLIAAFIGIALSPSRDPLALSDAGRQAYVYIAQVVGALLFAHIYLSEPQLFGRFQPYWPFIVMGIAFGAVGVGELLNRSGHRVLSEPLQRVGGFLPLLPALGWWLNPQLGIAAAGHYSALMFFAGLTYVILSMVRRSFWSGVAAAVAGNAALWASLADYESLSLAQHPQFWLIPPALSALIAAHLNRDQLSTNQLTAVRYACLLVIYVASTADVFIAGIGDTLWEPMLLATLAVIGVFVGIALRIRAFLYLGSSFVFLSVVSMVWHAYANVRHVGIWWAFGIALGLLILTVFGLFEKKRAELTLVVESMRKWDH
ncbi:MAG: hypothetical protein QGG36_02910 [Pirellulaceae bacterium]|nr:hypothetical protein [Pirellulaceae bacterium]MDP7014728.1 hypothetical protein [Pirellulaceae bacterium]